MMFRRYYLPRPSAVTISIFDLFTIGIGPSSSHTVGPMRAARRFAARLAREGRLGDITSVRVDFFGSLGHTGKGHGSDRAVILGLEGETPEAVDPDLIDARIAAIGERRCLRLLGAHPVHFDKHTDLVFHRQEMLPLHPNGMRFTASDEGGRRLAARVYYSVGGGFVVDSEGDSRDPGRGSVPYPFDRGDDLLRLGRERGVSISEMILENEKSRWPETEVWTRLRAIWRAMQHCVERGCRAEGALPGALKLSRRAPSLYRALMESSNGSDPLRAMEWIDVFALAVSEENAAGGRVVTAPTNGAAGIIPAVLHYYRHFVRGASDEGVMRFLLTAGAIGLLYKENASISGAEVGCQGEVGVACSMAAGALTEVLGGTVAQVENAAEIGMEHNLGLTCDPVGGLVQIPCIERNAMGAVKAVNAARLALRGDGRHRVSLDKVIATMRQTGADMQTKYKETSRGGLAVNVIEC